MLGMVLSLFVALALATFVVSVGMQLRSGTYNAQQQLNKIAANVSSQLASFRGGA